MAAHTQGLIFASSMTHKREPGMRWMLIALLFALAAMLPLQAQSQSSYVYVNNQTSPNSVSAYSVSAAGSLTQLPGSPFSTGGVGADAPLVCLGVRRATRLLRGAGRRHAAGADRRLRGGRDRADRRDRPRRLSERAAREGQTLEAFLRNLAEQEAAAQTNGNAARLNRTKNDISAARGRRL